MSSSYINSWLLDLTRFKEIHNIDPVVWCKTGNWDQERVWSFNQEWQMTQVEVEFGKILTTEKAFQRRPLPHHNF